jgi:hypothetical protein
MKKKRATITRELTNCFECKHRTELYGVPGLCKAFPGGIPEEILYDGASHLIPHPEQTGDFIFEPGDPMMATPLYEP